MAKRLSLVHWYPSRVIVSIHFAQTAVRGIAQTIRIRSLWGCVLYKQCKYFIAQLSQIFKNGLKSIKVFFIWVPV